MQKQYLTQNRIQDRDIVREHIIHRHKLLRVSSRVDNSSPADLLHIKKNLKKRYYEKNRKSFIESSNKLLVKKLVNVTARVPVANHVPLCLPFNRLKKIEQGIKISHENSRILDKIKKTKSHYSRTQLNKDYRFASSMKKMLTKNTRVPLLMTRSFLGRFRTDIEHPKSAKSLGNSYKQDVLIF